MKAGLGSSPQTRGAHVVVSSSHSGRGLIPADAGSTDPLKGNNMAKKAHPRRRGEHHPVQGLVHQARGSSPQTRGARRVTHGNRWHARLIPADAGSTLGVDTRPAFSRAHPRRRGEHLTVEAVARLFEGSSPQTRGAPVRYGLKIRSLGLIPADAGSTAQTLPSVR